MTPKERKIVFTLIGVMFLIMVTVIITKSAKKGRANAEAQGKQNSEVQDMSVFLQGTVENNIGGGSTNNTDSNDINNIVGTENNNVEDSGTQTNVGSTVVGMYKELVITNIEYKNENGGNKIVANITNAGSTTFQTEVAKLKLTKSTGEQIQSIITIPTIDAGGTAQFEHLLD